jgi:hypothetical protein
MKKKDINELKATYVGKKFNKLTILDIYYNTDRKDWRAVCQCECGERCDKSLGKVTSGHTKTCSGKTHKLEQSMAHSKWLHDHTEVILSVAEHNKEWYKQNKDKVKERSANHSIWWHENRGKVYLSHPTSKIKRQQVTYKDLLPILHPNFHDRLLSGDIKRDDIIFTKCPRCGNYDEHTFHNIYRLSSDSLKYGHPLLCRKCNMSHTSHYEQYLVDYISTFYTGTLIQNDRATLNGKELDLFYPEKKIAVEFNGDYWHSSKYKSVTYHYDKFIQCNDNDILLVSIFERHWHEFNEDIKRYLNSVFFCSDDSLSFKDCLMNNNYPALSCYKDSYNYIEDYYANDRDEKVYTCGYSSIAK